MQKAHLIGTENNWYILVFWTSVQNILVFWMSLYKIQPETDK